MGRIYHTAHKRSKNHNIIRSLVTELIMYKHIKVTKKRKEEVVKMFDRIITFAKKDDLHSQRKVIEMVRHYRKDQQGQYPLQILEKLRPHFLNKNGGYLNIYNLGKRRGDNATLYYLKWKI